MNRESLKRRIVARYSTRIHMSMILAATCLVAMISSWAMLHAGLHDMRWRYPVVVSLAYLTFLCGVWVWLHLAGFERSSKKGSPGLDVLDAASNLPSGGGSGGSLGGGGLGRVGGAIGRGGGAFDGGGASASFAESGGGMQAVALNPTGPAMAQSAGVGDGGGSEIGKAVSGLGDLGGDDIGAIILLILLAAAIFLASGYLIWMAPDILSEAAFGAVLAGGLVRKSKQQSAAGWVAGVVRKTWWPFAIVLVLAMVFAFYSKAHYPEANTFRETLRAVIAS
jgi:hypothetical protein